VKSLPSLVAVRHAPVADRWKGVCYGSLDVDVTVEHDVAADLVVNRVARRLDRIWSSSLGRCSGLAASIAERLGRPHSVHEALAELDHGTFEGRRWDAIHAEDSGPLARWGMAWLTEGPPGGESARSLEHRVRSWHDQLDQDSSHLLVAHAGVVRALHVVRGTEPWSTAIQLSVPHLEPIPFTPRACARSRQRPR
jgi:alpha-ribazole phosphatase